MPKRPKTVREEVVAERAKAARSPRKRKTAPASEALAEVIEQAGLKPATDILRPLEPATLESIEAAREEARHEEPLSPAERPASPHELNGKQHAESAPFEGPQSKWQDLGDRPKFAPIPEGFFGVSSIRTQDAGIRVNKSTIMEGGHKLSVSGLQFAENRLPSRDEKDFLEQIHEPDDALAEKRRFHWKPEGRQWERKGEPGEPLGDNVIDAQRIAEGLAATRREERERMEEVMGR